MLPRCAGVLIPLFSIRTDDDLGRGEILGLSAMFDLALSIGHRAIQLLPFNETAPAEPSPYSALSVFAIDPIYISLGAIESVDARAIAEARASLGGRRAAPRRKLRASKLAILEQAFRNFLGAASAEEHAAFDAFVEKNRGWLDDYALFRALKDRFKFTGWESWPVGVANRDPDALVRARRALEEPIRKYAYFQFVAHRQMLALRAEARRRGVMLGGDLSFSPSRDSVEVWANQEMFDLSRSVGAPPDAFNVEGQRWGLPMPNWGRMRAGGFRLWRIRARHAAALFDFFRVDHVVGLYRTFSFDAEPHAPGTFFPEDEQSQRAQGEEVMRAIKEEAGDSFVIAEDLGTVRPWVRESLTALGVPGYKVFRWEKENWGTPQERFVPPASYPELSIATTGTHDTETLCEWWRVTPQDERIQVLEALGLAGRFNRRSQRLSSNLLDAILETLYASPSILAVVPIQDLFGWSKRINLPGTVSACNWSFRLRFSLRPFAPAPAISRQIARLRAIAERTGRFTVHQPDRRSDGLAV
jgi:4-alpha-glucanotransferase